MDMTKWMKEVEEWKKTRTQWMEPCPGCGKTMVEEYDACEHCGWENDPLQKDDPDREGQPNGHSLNVHRKFMGLPPLKKVVKEDKN